MLFRMATPRRSKSGSITVRKGIPKDVRAEYQRMYGPGWEAKLTVPAGTGPQDAKVRISEWTADVETRIATIRAARRGEGRSLTERQAFALAGEWYVWFVARHEENPGPPERWKDLQEALGDHLMHHAPDHIVEQGWRALDWMREPEVLEGIRPQIADEAKTAQFLAAKGLVLSNDAQAMFLDRVLPEFMNAIVLLERRAGGDYETDERPAQFPKFEGGPRPSTTGMSPWALFEAWVKAAKPAPSTVTRWRAVFLDLEKRLADDPAALTEDAARDWARKLVAPGRSPRTVNDVWINAGRTIFAWGVEERLVAANPFQGVRVTQPRKTHHRETKAFTPAEAATILRAASSMQVKTPLDGAFRWVPWLCAYSGARAGEITQLRGSDIHEDGGVHAMLLTPEAGTMKTRKARRVPLHDHLVEQGFLEFVLSRGKGPLFFELRDGKGTDDPLRPKRPQGVIVRQKIAAWVRKQGVTDRELSPNHAWRHTFKQIADRAGISERTSDDITGHSHRTEGARYGAPRLEDMAAALGKFPRYRLARTEP